MLATTDEFAAGNVIAADAARVYQIDAYKGRHQIAECMFPTGGPWFCKHLERGIVVKDELQKPTLQDVLAWLDELGATDIVACADVDLSPAARRSRKRETRRQKVAS